MFGMLTPLRLGGLGLRPLIGLDLEQIMSLLCFSVLVSVKQELKLDDFQHLLQLKLSMVYKMRAWMV